ncbi:MAG: UbiA prenyltransferase family protein [Chitinophagaceae bacterium]|nr:UbiA prenyltransferase family protein [Chitinophagaceae bacterium]
MPVFWFSISFVEDINRTNALLIFIILHLLVYPSSNGYNSYMDQDTSSIGGIKNPPQPDKELFFITIVLDIIALLLSFIISAFFAGSLLIYIICSRLYSYRGIRLKKYPVLGYLTVMINQGGLVFFMIYHSAANDHNPAFPYIGCMTACLLIGGFYPITQIYQHDSDRNDHVTTISMILGKRGTFIFCGLLYVVAFSLLFISFKQQEQLLLFGILQIFFLPVAVYFFTWALKVWRDPEKADYDHTMKMNWIASTCTSFAFITIIMIKYFD